MCKIGIHLSCSTILLMLVATAATASGGTPELELTASDDCISADEIGDDLTVTLQFTNPGGLSLESFQAFLEFDDTALSFVSGTYGSQWDGAQKEPIVDAGGELEVAAAHVLGSGPATGDPIVFATLTFTVLAATDCVGTVVGFRTTPATEVYESTGSTLVSPLTLTDSPPIVIDTTAPTLACPADVEVECGDSTDPADIGMPTVLDDCDSDAMVDFDDDTDGIVDCVDGVLHITRTWSATDSCGNTGTCVQIITVIDTTNPVITTAAGDSGAECGPGAQAALDAWIADNGGAVAADGCDTTLTWSTDPASPALSDECGDTGDVTVTFIAADDCGNTATTTATFTVVDTTPPTFDSDGVPDDVTIECGDSTAPANTGGTATASDACGGVAITFDDDVASGTDCASFQIITRTWTATDDCGLSSTATQTITVEDTTNPQITGGFPADLTLQCLDDVPDADTDGIVAVDACSTVTVALQSETMSGAGCGASPKVIVRTYRATDACGNFVEQSQTITVADTTSPVLSATPADITVQGCDLPDAPAITASDNCDGDLGAITPVEVLMLTDCGGTGTVTRTWTATDACGNEAEHVQTITVVDTVKPVFTTFPADASYQCETDVPAPDTGLLAATDNCSSAGAILLEHVLDSPSGSGCASDPLIINRIYSATDECGNETTRTQKFTVADTTPPTFTSCPANLTVPCDASQTTSFLGTPVVSDNCDTSVTVTFEDVFDGDACTDPPYTLTRTFTATDDCDNTATCVQVVTLVDIKAPTILCPGDDDADSDGMISVTIFADPGGCTAVFDPGQATATDDCDDAPTITAMRDDGNGSNLGAAYTGTVVITWTATDCSNNSSTCTQTITVLPQNEVEATVELRNVSGGSFTRCIEFQLWLCDPLTGPVTIPVEVEFIDGVGTATLTPTCGEYDCITARDPLHTLHRTADDSDGNFGPVGTRYEADFTLTAAGGPNDLIPGDLDGDGDVDIIDGSRFVMEFEDDNAPGADTTCPITPGAYAYYHADLDGDAIVGAFDFSLLFAQLSMTSEANCCGQAGVTEPEMDILVADLERRGLHELVAVDLNYDGRVNVDDLIAFIGGARPGYRPPRAESLNDGGWFDAATWSGGVPDADADRRLDHVIVVDGGDAIARRIEIADGGALRITGGTLTASEIVVRGGGTLALDGEASLLSVGSLTLEDGADLQWFGGVLEIAGGTLTLATPDLIVGSTHQMSVLSLIDGAVASITRDIIVGSNGGLGGVEVSASTLSAGGMIQVGVTGEGWLELFDGGVAAAGDAIVVGPSGRVGGVGELIGTVVNDGVLAPRTVRIAGNYVQSGELLIELGAAGPEAVFVDGQATLGGSLRITLGDDDLPPSDERLTMLWAGRLDGRFARVERPEPPWLDYEISYRREAIELSVWAAAEHEAPD